MTALLDLLPLIAFFIASKKFGLLAGAAAVLAATLIVYGIYLMRQKWRLTKQQWVVLVLTILFCGFDFSAFTGNLSWDGCSCA